MSCSAMNSKLKVRRSARFCQKRGSVTGGAQKRDTQNIDVTQSSGNVRSIEGVARRKLMAKRVYRFISVLALGTALLSACGGDGAAVRRRRLRRLRLHPP